MTDKMLEMLIVVAIGVPVLALFLFLVGVTLFDFLKRYTMTRAATQSNAAPTRTAPLHEALLAEEEI